MNLATEGKLPVFTAGERTFTIEDVIQAGQFRGELDAPWRELLALGSCENSEDASQSASEEFRSERDLITAEETEAWLQERGLTLEDFSYYFARRCRRAPDAEAMTLEYPDFFNAPAEVQEQFLVDLMLSGEFDRLATRLAWRVAAWRQSPTDGGAGEPALSDLLPQLETAFARECVVLFSPNARARALENMWMPLTRVELESIEIDSLDAAQEAMLCVRVDGESMAQVAADGRYPYRVENRLLSELPEEVQQQILGASEREILPPLNRGGGIRLLRLVRKLEPSLDDPEIGARVEAQIIERHFSTLAAEHIRWTMTLCTPSYDAAA